MNDLIEAVAEAIRPRLADVIKPFLEADSMAGQLARQIAPGLARAALDAVTATHTIVELPDSNYASGAMNTNQWTGWRRVSPSAVAERTEKQ